MFRLGIEHQTKKIKPIDGQALADPSKRSSFVWLYSAHCRIIPSTFIYVL
jgi:hypothetical protein